MPSRHILTSPHCHYRILTTSSKHPSHKSLILPLVIAITVFIVVAAAAIALFYFLYFKPHKRQEISKDGGSQDANSRRIRRFKYGQLKRATKRFSQTCKLGKGGFGVVYRGLFKDGKEVAVKRLDLCSLQGEREFQNELSICGGLDSPYVVSLIGYCTHGKRVKLLVYECMPNRSLQEALFEKDYPEHLDWKRRFKIILDIAKALEFLHVGCNPPIIHGDVKPSNVLLDRDFSARIADFGLARVKMEQLGSDSARFSVSSEKLRPETSDKFRFGTPDYVTPGTPEMSRSSTTRNPLSDSSHKGTPVKEKTTVKEASFSIDILSPEHTSDAAYADALACSPTSFSHEAEHMSDVTESTRSPIRGKCCRGAKDDLKVGLQKGDGALEVESSATLPSPEDEVNGAKGSPPNRTPSVKEESGDGMWSKGVLMGQLSGKDYVLDWLGSRSELQEADQVVVCNGKDEHPIRADQKSSRVNPKSSRHTRLELSKENGQKESKKAKHSHGKRREWWKDEYFAELSGKNKSDVNKKTRCKHVNNWKYYLSTDLGSLSGELRTNHTRPMRGAGQSNSKEWVRSTRGGDVGGKERPWVPSILSDACSEEDRRFHFSGDLMSGELTKSGELVSRDVSSTTSMRGTVCYIAPEYGGNGVLSEMSDIYSFGVLLLVILSGRRPIQVTAAPMKEFERANLISWARNLSQCGKLLDLMDDSLREVYDREQATRCITLALLCLQRVPSTRPDISEIVKILSGEMEAPSLPLELSPSPPARIPYKLKSRLPKENQSSMVTP